MECAWSKLNIIIENNTAALNKILSSPWCGQMSDKYATQPSDSNVWW